MAATAGQISTPITDPNAGGWEDSAPQKITDPNAGGWEDTSAPQKGMFTRTREYVQSKIDAPSQKDYQAIHGSAPTTGMEKTLDAFGRHGYSGITSMFSHPWETAKGFAKAATPDSGAAGIAEAIAGPAAPIVTHSLKQLYNSYKSEGGGAPGVAAAVGDIGGGLIGGELLGAGISGAVKGAQAVPKVANAIGSNVERAVTNTTPRDVGDFARGVAKENVKAAAKDAATEADAQDAAAAATAREAAQNHINTVEPQIKARLKTAQTNALAKANGKYDSLNSALEGEQTHPEFAQELLDDATNSMKGSATETPVMKDIEDQFMPVKRSQTGKIMRDEDGEPIREDSQPISYRDLQGYRSEINAALKGHNLPGDVYQAYKGMLDSIDDQMQKIAERNNLGDDMADARATWQKYANTFQEPSSPAYKALYSKFPKNGAAIRVFQNNDAGLNALAEHDPTLAGDIDQARKVQASIRGTSSQARPTAPQTVKVVQPEDVQQAKADNVVEAARKKARYLSGAGASVPALWEFMHGRIPNLPEIAMAGGGGAAIGTMLDRYFTSPKNLARLSEVTPADFAELQRHLPPEQIGDFSRVLAKAADRARAQGIAVSPAVRHFLTTVGATQGLALPSSHPLSSQFIPQVATGATK